MPYLARRAFLYAVFSKSLCCHLRYVRRIIVSANAPSSRKMRYIPEVCFLLQNRGLLR